jgi:hypothetical protein
MSFVGSNILAGASGQGGAGGGYEIERSLRFNSADSAYLNRTPSSAGNRRTWTWSGWVKRSTLGGQKLFIAGASGTEGGIQFYSGTDNNGIEVYDYSGSYTTQLDTSQLFRDVSAWYHIVLAYDTTQSTAANRVKLYINGLQVDDFATETYPSQNYEGHVNNNIAHTIGAISNPSSFFNGYLADVHFIDGQALAATDFGETDDNGVWQPKKFNGTYGPIVDQSQTWSNSITTALRSGDPATKGFDGNPDTNTVVAASDAIMNLDFSGITVNSKIEIRSETGYNTPNCSVTVGGVTTNAGGDPNTGVPGTNGTTTKVFNVSGTLTNIKIGKINSGRTRLSQLFIDGKLLVDSGVTVTGNSFHLDFADNSSDAALGTDTSGNSNTWTVNNLNVSGQSGTNSGKSWYFNGGNNTSITANDSDLALGNGDWTVEMFIKPESGVNGQSALTSYNSNHPIFETDSSLKLRWFTSSTYNPGLATGTWYHIAWVRHGSNGYIYLNGNRIANRSYSEGNLTNSSLAIGNRVGNGVPWKGLISNVHIVVGTALYTGGTYNIPFTPITPVANTKLLTCHSSTLTDGSGNNITLSNNGATVSNEVPSGSASGTNTTPGIDSLVDTPTNGTQTDTGAGGEVVANYCTWNALDQKDYTLTNGNLDASSNAGAWRSCRGTIGMSSGKWYWEVTSTNDTAKMIGIATSLAPVDNWAASSAYGWIYNKNGYKYHNGGYSGYGATYTTGDVIGVAFDADNGSLAFYKNGASQGTAYTGLTSGPYFPVTSLESASSVSANFGARAFAYTAPSGYKALCTANLPDTTIADGSLYFDTKLYSGDGTNGRAITGLNYSPDLVWIKARNQTDGHNLFDIVRGATKVMKSNNNNVELTESNSLTAFNSDGFTVGNNSSNAQVNASGFTYAAWAWDAGSYNTTIAAGSISSGVPSRASTVRANPSAGFSIVSFTANGTAGTTIAHGLNAVPEFIVVKDREYAQNWQAYHGSLGGTKMFNWNTDESVYTDGGGFNNTNPTSSVITLGNYSGYFGTNEMIAYCFTSILGYSKISSYTGNGSADGPFIYTGFRPAWIMTKEITQAYPWQIQDTTRAPKNDAKEILYSNETWAEASANANMDILSNGFKPRRGSGYFNQNGGTIIYVAFAENPFKIARAR